VLTQVNMLWQFRRDLKSLYMLNIMVTCCFQLKIIMEIKHAIFFKRMLNEVIIPMSITEEYANSSWNLPAINSMSAVYMAKIC
jgi:hypothetical protein